MKDNWLRYFLVLCFGFVFSARAQLQFTNSFALIVQLTMPTSCFAVAHRGAHRCRSAGRRRAAEERDEKPSPHANPLQAERQ